MAHRRDAGLPKAAPRGGAGGAEPPPASSSARLRLGPAQGSRDRAGAARARAPALLRAGQAALGARGRQPRERGDARVPVRVRRAPRAVAAAARAARCAPADPEDGGEGEGEGDGRAALLGDDDGGLKEALAAAVALRRRTLVRLMLPYLTVACTLGLTEPGGARRRSLPERCLRVLLFKARGPYYYINIAVFTALLLPSIARLSLRAPAALLAAALLARLACVAAFPGEPFVTPLLLPRYLCFYVIGWEYAARWAAAGADGGWADARRRRVVAVCLACALALPPVMLRRQYESTSAPVQVAIDAVRHCGFMAASIAVMEAAAASSAAAPLAVRMLSDLSYTVYLYHLYFIEAFDGDAGGGGRTGVRHMLVAGLCFGLLGGLNVGIWERVLLGKRRAMTFFGARLPAIA